MRESCLREVGYSEEHKKFQRKREKNREVMSEKSGRLEKEEIGKTMCCPLALEYDHRGVKDEKTGICERVELGKVYRCLEQCVAAPN